MTMNWSDLDIRRMKQALNQARRAAREGEVPVGAVLVSESGKLLAEEHNRSILACDPTAHAEILALRAAAACEANYRLSGSTLYVTLEPCPMCAGALIWARIKRVVIAAKDPKAGALGSVLDLSNMPTFNHRFEVQYGLGELESLDILHDFFAARR